MKQLEITDEIIAKARRTCETTKAKPAGYRLKVYCLGSDDTYSTKSGEKGVIVKPLDQKERETRGSDRGILVDIGIGAWKGEHLEGQGPWAKIGQVVLYQNYEGKADEEPKGSGNMYRWINDESILGYYEDEADA